MIVADAGPLIVFARIGRLSLLHDIVESLTVPPAVYDEITVSGMAGAEELARAAPRGDRRSGRSRSGFDGRFANRPYIGEEAEQANRFTGVFWRRSRCEPGDSAASLGMTNKDHWKSERVSD